MSDEQFLVLVSMLKGIIRGQMTMEEEIASLKVEIDRLRQVGSSVDQKLEKMDKLGRKISKKL